MFDIIKKLYFSHLEKMFPQDFWHYFPHQTQYGLEKTRSVSDGFIMAVRYHIRIPDKNDPLLNNSFQFLYDY